MSGAGDPAEDALPRVIVIAPSNRRIGGQALHAATLVESLRRRRYDARLLPIDPEFPGALSWCRRLPFIRTLINQSLYLPSLWQLRRADIVQASSASYWSFLLAPVPAMLAGRLFRKRVVLNYHSGEAEDHLANWGALVHPWLALAHEIVVPSAYLRQVFASHGYRTRVIHNTVDTSLFTYRVREPLRPRLLSIRNFEWHYAVDQTLHAFAMVKREYPEATLEIAGAGRLESDLRALAQSLGLDGVRFLGPLPAAAMPSVHDRADIFLNSSVIDNQPLSVLEAMASGLPIVSTGVGDIANMIEDGVTGAIVPERDPAAMAAAVLSLLREPRRAQDMAARAHARLARYSWRQVGAEWSALYADLIGRANTRCAAAKRSAA